MAGGKGCGCDQKGVAPGRSLGGGPVCTLTSLVTGISMNFYALLNDTELHTHTHTHTHTRCSSANFLAGFCIAAMGDGAAGSAG